MKPSSTKIFTLTVIIVVAGLFITFIYTALGSNTTTQAVDIPAEPTATPIPSQNADVHSADGKMNLNLNAQKNGSTTSYTVTASDASGTNQHTLFTKIVSGKDEITIPLNSWSPDNQYVFIVNKENNQAQYLVFKASGDSLANGQQYANVTALFKEKKPDVIMNEVTGWDSPTLLHITTVSDGDRGAPFWFDVPSQSFIQLMKR